MIETFITLEGRAMPDFDKRTLRLGLRKAAAKIRKDARKNLSRRAVSQAGEFPGMDTGDTRQSIRVRVSKSGWTAVVEPKRTPRMNQDKFYPQILVHGRKKKRPLSPRKDPVRTALDDRRGEIQQDLFNALHKALEFRA